MARRSNKSIAEILNASSISPAAAKVHASSPFSLDIPAANEITSASLNVGSK
jgi:hypothetical protein